MAARDLRVPVRAVRRAALLVVGSSVLYYVWRHDHPERARWVNKHAWIAIGLNFCANVALLHIFRR